MIWNFSKSFHSYILPFQGYKRITVVQRWTQIHASLLQNGGHWTCFDLKTTYNLIADRIEVFIFKSHKINAETHLSYSPPPQKKKKMFSLNLTKMWPKCWETNISIEPCRVSLLNDCRLTTLMTFVWSSMSGDESPGSVIHDLLRAQWW
jgi:hypothetical protein